MNPQIRRSELATIESAIAQAGAGGCAVVVVDGEPGIGKTHLLDAAAARAEAAGALVLRSGLTEVETTLSWAGVSVLLGDVDGRDLEEIPEGRRHALDRARGVASTGEIEAEQVASALADVVRQLSEDRTVLIVLDDLQWLDRASAAAITYAVRANAHARLAVLAAHRLGVPVPVDLGRIRDVELERITLSGLSAAGLHHVLEERQCPVARRADLVRIHEVSGGNPLYAVELARRLSGGSSVPSQGLSSMDELAFARLDGLDDVAVRTARVCALVARPNVRTVRDVVGDDTMEALAELERRKVITSTDGAIEFTHPLRRAAVLQGLGELERRGLHRRISEVLDDPEQSVLHASEAAHDPDADLAHAVEQAGDAAAALGVLDLASARYRRAAELTPADDVGALWRRQHRAVRSAVAVGDHGDLIEEAEAVYRTAPTVDDVAEALLDLIDVRFMTEGIAAGIEAVRDGLARLDGSPHVRAAVHERLVRLEHHRDMAAARRAASAVLDDARASGDGDLLRRAEIIDACSAVLVGEPVEVTQLALPADMPADAGVDASVLLSEILVWTNHLERAEVMLRQMEAQARRQGAHTALQRTLLSLADAFVRWGRWDDAEACLREVGELVDPIGLVVGDQADMAWIHAARGEQELARSYLTANAQRVRAGLHTDRIQHLARAGFVALCEGAWPEAVRHLTQASDVASELGFVDLAALPYRHDLVEALLNLGALAEAERVAAEMTSDADRARVPGGQALALRCQLLVVNARGRIHDAVELAEAAVAAHDGVPLVFEAARTELAAGSVLRRAGRRSVARGHLEAARDTFARLRAVPFEQRATSELERLGARRVSTGLTVSEQRVAGLVVAGRTNAEVAAELFISLRTVESNLTRVYRKLGVRSRTELAAQMRNEA